MLWEITSICWSLYRMQLLVPLYRTTLVSRTWCKTQATDLTISIKKVVMKEGQILAYCQENISQVPIPEKNETNPAVFPYQKNIFYHPWLLLQWFYLCRMHVEHQFRHRLYHWVTRSDVSLSFVRFVFLLRSILTTQFIVLGLQCASIYIYIYIYIFFFFSE